MGVMILPFGITVLPDLSILICASPAGAEMTKGGFCAQRKKELQINKPRVIAYFISFFSKTKEKCSILFR
jgi:hypothetical protein